MGKRILVKARFVPISKTLAKWQEENPILLAGEHGVAADGNGNKREKIGDGITPWNELEWWSGASAYEVAVANGFKGTQEEWLVSLKGANGKDAEADQNYSPTSENAQSGKAVAEALNNKLEKKIRSFATNSYKYNHKAESVPYFYGVFGDKENDFTETQGLIKGSMGKTLREMIENETDPEKKALLEQGVLPDHNYADPHTVAIKDGNASIPVGIVGGPHAELDEETGTFPSNGETVLWYGAAVPHTLMWDVHGRSIAYAQYQRKLAEKYADKILENVEGGAVDQVFNCESENAQSGKAVYNFVLPFFEDIQNLTNEHSTQLSFLPVWFNELSLGNGSMYQKSEKDDTQVNLKFTEIQDNDAKSTFARVYNRTTETGANATSLGSSIATEKRSFAAGSSNIAAAEKAFATGCDNIAAGKQSFVSGYANYVESASSAAFGQQNVVKGACSFVAGLLCKAVGMFSTVFGNSNIANFPNQFVVGKFNNNKSDTVFEVGYGADESNRSNLFEVGKNWDTGDNFIRVGNTEVTEKQLKNLLEILELIEK